MRYAFDLKRIPPTKTGFSQKRLSLHNIFSKNLLVNVHIFIVFYNLCIAYTKYRNCDKSCTPCMEFTILC